MERVTLRHTDLAVSRACFGSMTFGSQVDEAAARRMVDLCFDSGINFFDTADVYNGGAAEVILGKTLQGRRDKVVLASKARFGASGAPAEAGLSRAALLSAVDDSLRRLGTDYLDLYYLHAPDYSVPIEETLEAMDRIVRAGKVRYPGTSNYAGWQVCRMHWISEKEGYRPPHVSQPVYNLLARGVEQEYLPMCKELGISTVAYSPLAAGLLTGKHRRDRPEPGTRFDGNPLYLDRYWHPACFDAVDQLDAVAREAGRSPASLALNWLLCHTAIDAAILGASSLDQLQDNLKCLDDGPLTPDVLAVCDRVWAGLRGVSPRYNR